MPIRLIIDQELAEPIPSETQYENDFESAVMANAANIFRGWHVCRFKCMVHAPGTAQGKARGDLALVDTSAQDWWVVEVELSHHSLEGHVLPQVEALSLGLYGEKHVIECLRQSLPSQIPNRQLIKMVVTRQPRVLVVVNDYAEGWPAMLADYAKVLIFKPFRDKHGQYRYILDGDLPTRSTGQESVCVREDAMPGSLMINSPLALGLVSGTKVKIQTENGTTMWKYHRLGENSFLFALGGFPLPKRNKYYLLSRDSDDILYLKAITTRKGRYAK